MNKFSKLMAIGLFVFIISTPQSQAAGLYFAGSINGDELASDEEETKHKFKGGGIGFTLGYELPFVSVEGIFKYFSVKADYTNSKGQAIKAKISDRMLGIGMRTHFLLFFSFKAGVAFHNFSSAFTIDDRNFESTLNGADTGVYLGIGGKIPLGKVEPYADIGVITASDTGAIDFEIGARFFVL